MKRIAILGSTGSIGTQTLEVASWRGYEVVGLAAGKNASVLLEQVQAFRPQLVSCSQSEVETVRPHLPSGTQLIAGIEGAEAVARLEVDTVVAAIPGFVGVAPTIAALREGRHVALANKETMVVAGVLVNEVATKNGATITPIDSEHSALFQCLVGEEKADVSSLVLTASGGPFRLHPEDLTNVTPEQALAHPTWTMGPKVTIDSATLFNKGLEVLEAHYLFEVPLDMIEVVIHPQSLIHGLVRFADGSIKAQIGPHDMRLPIQYGIEHPARPNVPLDPLPLVGRWELSTPDSDRFPCLDLAYRAGTMGGVAPAALNAADEIAVNAFLAGKIRFTDISELLERVLEQTEHSSPSWEAIYATDQEARRRAEIVVDEPAA
jgi:1-deoxy-D-xylulose-5-phosphate reductoisomerase